MAPNVLECSGLRRSYGERLAVREIGFSIAEGETYGLLGPNGSGKTTTISMIAGVLRADAGTVHVAGRPITTAAGDAKAAVGLVPQEIALYPDLSARENLRFFGRLQGMGRKRLEQRIDEVLAVVGLADRAGDRVDAYSGGMKRRANIAAGLLHEPKLLILDEPTVGVDPQSRNQILASIEALGGAGLSVLYTTHYMEEAERLCDRIGIMDEGRIIAEGTQRDLVALVGAHDRLTLEGSGDTARFLGACAAVPGVVTAGEADGTVEVAAEEARTALPAVMAAATASGWAVSSVAVREPDLEAVFLHLTGRALRD